MPWLNAAVCRRRTATSASECCFWADWISSSAALTAGAGATAAAAASIGAGAGIGTEAAGIGTEAVLRGNGSAGLIGFGRATLKIGMALRMRGHMYPAAALMPTKTNKDTTIPNTRPDRLFGATGSLSRSASLFGASAIGSFSKVSANGARLGSAKQGQSRR